jgi:hypothetical protein
MKFRVGALDYHVKETQGLFHKHELFGQVTFDDGMIEIDSSLCEQRKHNVIIHELTHAIFFEAGYDEHEEEMVRRLGNVLTQVLRDNDFDFLREEEEVIELEELY